MITKAVLACGGWSTRFLPTTKIIAKQLVPIFDRPQILFVLEECLNSGITEFCIVHRDGDNSLQSFFSDDPALTKYLADNNKTQYLDQYNSIKSRTKKLVFLPQTDSFPYGNGSPVLVSKEFIGNDSFVYMYADDFILEPTPGSFLSKMISTYENSHPQAVCGSQPVDIETINKLSSIKFVPNTSQIETVIEKPEPQNAPSNICIFGRFVFNPKIISVLEHTDVARGELWMTDAVNNLAKTDVVLSEPTVDPIKWITTGDPLNWLKATISVAMANPQYEPELKKLISTL